MSYYVRWRGQITGPYTQEAVLEMWAQRRVTRFHELSEDQKQWKPLLDFDAFRKPSPDAHPTTTRTVLPAQDSAPAAGSKAIVRSRLRVRDDLAIPETDGPPPGEVFWYCLPGQQVQGPLSAAALKFMANRGDIPADTMICLAADESAGEQQSIRWMPMKHLDDGSFHNQLTGELNVPEDSWSHPTAGSDVSSLATASLILGLLTIIPGFLVFGLPFAIAAVVTGHMARGRTGQAPGVSHNSGRALAGLILGYACIAVSLLAALGFVTYWKVKSSRAQSTIQSQPASLKLSPPDTGIAMGNFNGSTVTAAANQTRSNATPTDSQNNASSSVTTQRAVRVKKDDRLGNLEAKKDQRPENPDRQNREH